MTGVRETGERMTVLTRTRRVEERADTNTLLLVTEIICGLGRCQIPFVTMLMPCDVCYAIVTSKLRAAANGACD